MRLLEKLWMTVATTTVVSSAIVSGAPLPVIGTVTLGILFVTLVAFKKPLANLFGFLLAVSFGYMSYQQGFLMNAASNLLYVAPASLFGWWYWNKYKDAPVRKMTLNELYYIPVAVVIGMATSIFISVKYGANHAVLDGITGFLPIAATAMLILRYRAQWFLWIPYNAIEVFMWFSAASLVPEVFAIFVMRAIFFVNSLIGAYQWYKVK